MDNNRTLTAFSQQFGEFPVIIAISKSFSVYSQIEINGKLHRVEFRIVEGQPVAELWPSAIESLGLNKKTAFIRLRTDFRQPLAEMEKIAADLKAASHKKQIDELLASGKQVYAVSRAGDSYKLELHICEPTSNQNLKPEYKQLIPFTSDQIESNDLSDQKIKWDWQYVFGGFYGDIAIITKEQHEAILARRQERKLAAEEKVQSEQKASQELRAAKFDQARTTNQPVELSKYSDLCNDFKEECNTDLIIIYAMPDGTTKTERQHTW